MRIISGMRRGLKLDAPDGLDTRPTSDKVKQALFNIIQYNIPADSVLDLFSGSGALGIEALSRGCGHCVFVDSGRDAARLTAGNIARARFDGNAEVLNLGAAEYLKQCKSKFDIIFMDPPYNRGFIEPAICAVHKSKLLNDGGLIAVETERGGEPVPDFYYPIKRAYTYGKTVITILQG